MSFNLTMVSLLGMGECLILTDEVRSVRSLKGTDSGEVALKCTSDKSSSNSVAVVGSNSDIGWQSDHDLGADPSFQKRKINKERSKSAFRKKP